MARVSRNSFRTSWSETWPGWKLTLDRERSRLPVSQRFLAGFNHRENGFGIVNSAAPSAAAYVLQGGPDTCVVREVGVWREVGTRRPGGQYTSAFFHSKSFAVVAHQIDRALQLIAVHDNFDE